MIDYPLAKPLAQDLYRHIRRDIESGRFSAHTRLPSKRTFAADLGISLSTVEQALSLLEQEGYIECVERKGIFVLEHNERSRPDRFQCELLESDLQADDPDFPSALWFKTMRMVMSRDEAYLLQTSPVMGSARLRNIIALYLNRSRGMHVHPRQIVIASGAQDLYAALSRLFASNFHVAIESPGYPAMVSVYSFAGAQIEPLELDEHGICAEALENCSASFLQVSPFSSFPEGSVTSASRRKLYLDWISKRDGYLIEDDFNSEFFQSGPPLQTLYSMDSKEKVIYLNTFSQSLSSSLRLAYMVLPETLIEPYRKTAAGLKCTVTMLEQYTLAEFIENGSFERLIARRRRKAAKKLAG